MMGVRDTIIRDCVEIGTSKRKQSPTINTQSRKPVRWSVPRIILTILIWGAWLASTVFFGYVGWTEENNPFLWLITFPHLLLLVIPSMFMWVD